MVLQVELATNIKIIEHQTNPNSTFTEKVINLFHEVNELYDRTLNEVYNLFYATGISSNKSFTFRNTLKQDDNLAFVDAMEKYISDHENGGHWSIVCPNTLLNKLQPIKTTWLFKRKRQPDGDLLKH